MSPQPGSHVGPGLYRCPLPDQSVYEAIKPIRCEECHRTIEPGALFSRLRLRVPACRECRPFAVVLEDEGAPMREAMQWASAAFEHIIQEIQRPRCDDETSARILLECIHEGRAALARLQEAEEAARQPQGAPP